MFDRVDILLEVVCVLLIRLISVILTMGSDVVKSTQRLKVLIKS